MFVSTKVAGILKHLAVILQTETIDLTTSYTQIHETAALIKLELSDETKFEELYDKAKVFSFIEIDLKVIC